MTFRPIPKPKNHCRCGCGTEIKATKKWVSGHNLKRRPKDAIVKNGRLYKETKCTECGEKFIRRADQINRHSMINLCSRKCVSVRQSRERTGRPLPKARTGEYKECIQCRESFYVFRSRIKNGNPQYCSKKCESDRKRERGIVSRNFIGSADNKGKKNGMYKHGGRTGAGVSKKKLRIKIIERDGGDWCLLCGKPAPGLHLHRIKYGAQGGKYELDNCVQLCAKDHAKVHSSKRKWMPILLDHIENGTLTHKDAWD